MITSLWVATEMPSATKLGEVNHAEMTDAETIAVTTDATSSERGRREGRERRVATADVLNGSTNRRQPSRHLDSFDPSSSQNDYETRSDLDSDEDSDYIDAGSTSDRSRDSADRGDSTRTPLNSHPSTARTEWIAGIALITETAPGNDHPTGFARRAEVLTTQLTSAVNVASSASKSMTWASASCINVMRSLSSLFVRRWISPKCHKTYKTSTRRVI